MPTWIRNGRAAAAVAGVLLAGLLLYPVAIPLIAHLRDPRQALADYSLNLDRSQDIVRQRAYPPRFAYPLPGVLARAALGAMGETPSAVVWAGLLVSSGLLSARLLARRLEPTNPARGLVAVTLGFFACKYYVEWDLRALNCNLVYLALVLAAVVALEPLPRLSGALLASSVGLKLYSAALIPWLAWQKRWRGLAWTLVWLVLLFGLMPALSLGIHSTIDLNRQWLAEVGQTADPHFALTFPAYVVAPVKLVHYLFGAGVVPGSPAWLPLEPRTVDRLAQGIKVGWLAAVAGYFLIRARRHASARGACDLVLADTAVLLLAPLPISPLLQPHQCVVLVIPSVLFAHQALRREAPRPLRVALAGILLAGLLVHEVGPGGLLRGLGVGIHFLLTILGLGAMVQGTDAARRVAPVAAESVRKAA